LQLLNDRTQPIALARYTGDLFGMMGALGDDQRAERFEIIGKIVGVIERHTTGCNVPAASFSSGRARSAPR
jgi:hypothetical protein